MSSDEFGRSVALDRDTLAVGAHIEDSSSTGVNGNQADNSASRAGAVYVFQRAGGVWSQQAYIKASNTGAGDEFGLSVALDGDTLAVGALAEASNATGINGLQSDNSFGRSGAVYVFTRTGGIWSQQAYLKASNTGPSDQFGVSLALEGDTLAVGANGESSGATGVNGNQADNSAPSSGAVYVFSRNAGVWSQQAYIKASNTETLDGFGFSVALNGDTLAVGAAGEDSGTAGIPGNQSDNLASGSGAVYVFTRSSGLWSQQAYIKASNPEANDAFGRSLALHSQTLAVGADGESSNATGINGLQSDNSASSSGAVYVFVRSAGVWSQQAYVKASNTGALDQFGRSIALESNTLVVGARAEDSNATGVNGNDFSNSASFSGAVYLFSRSSGLWSQRAYIKASNTDSGDSFGESVALAGPTLAIGATGEDSAATGVNGSQSNSPALLSSGASYVRRIAPSP